MKQTKTNLHHPAGVGFTGVHTGRNDDAAPALQFIRVRRHGGYRDEITAVSRQRLAQCFPSEKPGTAGIRLNVLRQAHKTKDTNDIT